MADADEGRCQEATATPPVSAPRGTRFVFRDLSLRVAERGVDDDDRVAVFRREPQHPVEALRQFLALPLR
ncbi:hypothetical protein [Actinoallomurus iriomotensis]|uniref:hypothetical protein n=1 Tax=Actinoallomurus iriomotensis TaxID=478107 RepID=UPI002555062A|nr:hypothetical protein [Actinoallomurus iriomotensis]